MEVLDLMECGEMILITAQERKETRGLHIRSDFPFTNPLLAEKWITIKKEYGRPKVEWQEKNNRGFIAERIPLRSPEGDIAGRSLATRVSCEWPITYPAPHGRHCSSLSFEDHAGWEVAPPGGKIGLNEVEGDSASRCL